MRMLTDPHLTVAHDPIIDAQARETYPGVAHLAGTGPPGTTCRTCVNWAMRFWEYDGTPCDDMVTSFRRDAAGHLKPRCCKKFYRMMQSTIGGAVPHSTPSCRHYQENEKAPTIAKRTKGAPKP